MIVRRALVVAALALVLLPACQPFFVTSPGVPCYVGTFTLKAQTFTRSLNTPVGAETVSLLPGGNVTLTTTQTTWSVSGTETVSATGAFVGTVAVTASAGGTLTERDGGLDFTVTSLSGSAIVNGTVNGQAISMTVPMPGSWIDAAIGLSGHADYTCGVGTLSLRFGGMRLDF